MRFFYDNPNLNVSQTVKNTLTDETQINLHDNVATTIDTIMKKIVNFDTNNTKNLCSIEQTNHAEIILQAVKNYLLVFSFEHNELFFKRSIDDQEIINVLEVQLPALRQLLKNYTFNIMTVEDCRLAWSDFEQLGVLIFLQTLEPSNPKNKVFVTSQTDITPTTNIYYNMDFTYFIKKGTPPKNTLLCFFHMLLPEIYLSLCKNESLSLDTSVELLIFCYTLLFIYSAINLMNICKIVFTNIFSNNNSTPELEYLNWNTAEKKSKKKNRFRDLSAQL